VQTAPNVDLRKLSVGLQTERTAEGTKFLAPFKIFELKIKKQTLKKVRCAVS